MTRLRDKIDAELDNIKRSVDLLPPSQNLSTLSALELAGVAGILNSFYNGVENILKQIIRHNNWQMPSGESWHREILKLTEDKGIMSSEIILQLRDYLGFRHFFTHAYAMEVDPQRMEYLVAQLPVLIDQLTDSFKTFD